MTTIKTVYCDLCTGKIDEKFISDNSIIQNLEVEGNNSTSNREFTVEMKITEYVTEGTRSTTNIKRIPELCQGCKHRIIYQAARGLTGRRRD